MVIVCFADPDNCHTDPDPTFHSGVDPDFDSTLQGALQVLSVL
jgi:hypothetical protein